MSKQPHILVEPHQVSDKVIVCGEPDRVNRIAEHLSDVEFLAENREFRLVRGLYNQSWVTVCSTGIGAASALIALEELQQCGMKQMVRVGSAGALQNAIALGDIIIAEAAVRDEGGSNSYVKNAFPACSDTSLVNGLNEYCDQQQISFHSGVVRSHDSFYTDEEQEICRYWHQKGVLGADMETSALLTVGRLRGVKVAAILTNVVLFEQDVQQGVTDYVAESAATMQGERHAILAALHALTR
ncbi:nucleoside phosphorylase [Photobacterium sp. SDRW27]|uniref:nucleoside phosphorylase n=1 Tax=Photobacterium obscurum TaxID=2829490 RepID=UPI0022443873|nr:nucleoside phosphorylase [Photobacterium obscurum]MCW8330007.1 nucleoside phosphorylase [Photobacterium obscurum]